MLTRCIIFLISLLFVIITAQNKIPQSSMSIDVDEHEPSNIDTTDSDNQIWQTTTERTLIRVTRLQTKTDQPKINKRTRRQIIDGEEILGMAKTVAIVVLVIISLCIVCCLITTVVVCVKCFCGGNSRKRNQGPTTIQVPQPIFVHTGPTGYQPQYHQQQAPQTWSPVAVQSPESRPMLPQPSAPPRPIDHFHMEHPPPPYEKLYTRN